MFKATSEVEGSTGQLIHMRNVPGTADNRALDAPLFLLLADGSTGEVPKDFEWDGASVPMIFQGLFPRHNHPIASCRHDYGCGIAKNAAERKFYDQRFQIDVGTTSWWMTKKIGYIGVRIGAFFGIGNNFQKGASNEADNVVSDGNAAV
jgi:hypothetical protein